jgi:hypothetical protein
MKTNNFNISRQLLNATELKHATKESLEKCLKDIELSERDTFRTDFQKMTLEHNRNLILNKLKKFELINKITNNKEVNMKYQTTLTYPEKVDKLYLIIIDALHNWEDNNNNEVIATLSEQTKLTEASILKILQAYRQRDILKEYSFQEDLILINRYGEYK